MRIKKGFVCREICGEHVVSGEGVEQVNFSKLISLNESAAYLWKKLEGKDFTPEDMADLLCAEYDVDHETALADSEALCRKWADSGLIE